MSSIFRKDDNYVDKPNRNTFDLSWQNNLSLKFGKLVPCFCQEVIPGDSFKIQPTFGLRFLPQVFPVQTRMRAHMHFFYVRNRTIWKDWMDFIGKTKEGLTMPYIKPINSFDDNNNYRADSDPSFEVSSIYDYMGLPVSVDSNIDPVNYRLFSYRGDVIPVVITKDGLEYDTTTTTLRLNDAVVSTGNSFFVDALDGTSRNALYREFKRPIYTASTSITGSVRNIVIQNVSDFSLSDYKYYLLAEVSNIGGTVVNKLAYVRLNSQPQSSLDFSINQNILNSANEIITCRVVKILGYVVIPPGSSVPSTDIDKIGLSVEVLPSFNRNYPFSCLSANTLPYGNGDYQYRINALPFRAYEAVYNSFYRNPENNPFKINGVPEYNKYVTSDDGGEQYSTSFSLYNRNWEDDAFTTAVPTPQQGDAPRVGLTGNPNEPVKLFYANEDGSVGHISLNADSNGVVTMLRDSNDETTNEGLVNALNDAVNFGITINDLRNVNALQLWLEKNVRKGYKYRDQLMSHYGVKISYNDLLMPEFIGGVSRDVTVNQISQTVETDTGNLGDMAGQAYVVGEGNSVTHFCDEHGYIIGILSVVPVPNYSQMIPKHFFKHDTFDYFFPEFGKIGMQPITNKEIAATASWLTHKGDDTFGYQRAWYDYLANVDQVHGKFNSDFYNFLIQRKFGNVPELGADFTTVKNEDLNNIFYTDSDDDKILGQIYFDVKAIRPIPLFGIPSLE